MGNANSSQTRRRRRTGNGAEMFAGFQPGTQVGLGVGRPGARVGAGRPGARRWIMPCLLYTSPSPRDATLSRMPSSA